jgi:hypothetical protein
MRRLAVAIFFVLLFASRVFAQAGNASLTGFIQDPSKAFIPGVRVLAINTDTNQQFQATTNKDGGYNITSLPVGPYRMQIEKIGFQTILKEDLFLHTQDVLQINYQMAVGSTSETVTVSGESNSINTTDATVGSVIDRKFVQDMPLNGRSFQSLILLSPGIVTNTPQGTDPGGEFSVNGLRTDSNNFMLDGVSAMNTAALGFSRVTSTGSLSTSTVLGTTQSIISIDALQEFRIATSTYSAEYGRQPGAQISFTSRTGTNEYHGTLFDYLRNYAFDANNWFNDDVKPVLAKPAERQNDFGGTLGGPLGVPGVISGKDRAFFFFSYEGLRLLQPLPASISYVPSNGTYNTATYANPLDMNLRANAPAALQPVLNGFPQPNCSTLQDPQCVDYGNGLSPFIVSTTEPSAIDSIMARVDYQALPWLRLFARYSDTESSSASFGSYGSVWSSSIQRNRSYLVGADSAFHDSIANDLRLQYAPASAISHSTGQPMNGSVPVVGPTGPNFNTMQGLPPVEGKTEFEMENFTGGGGVAAITGWNYGSLQFQSNAVDTISWTHGSHVFKAGVDYRQTTAYLDDGNMSYSPTTYYFYESGAQIRSNSSYEIVTTNNLRQDPTAKNLGLFIQDEWRVRPRLSLSLGLRWDLNPPPSISGAPQYTYTGNINNPSTLALSRLGAPLYKTTYTDFAPRFGLAYQIRNQPGHELVLRAGGGLFYDTGQSTIYGTLGSGHSLGASSSLTLTNGAAFPIPASTILAAIQPPTSPYALNYVIAPDFVPPSALQWSVGLEQSLGQAQSVTATYVGTEGKKLSLMESYTLTGLSPLFSTILQFQNGPGSNYNALQLQYKRQALRGLQVIAGYTWSHAIDWDSTEAGGETPQRGNSDNDVRHNFTAALVYNLPTQYSDRWQRAILGGWSTDLHYVARTGFPVQVNGPTITDPVSGLSYDVRLNYNGQNPYVHASGIPGGRQFNPAVFSVPTAAEGANGNSPRNFLRGFGEQEADLAIQRVFPIYEKIHLQFRAEAFNIANHPNFGAISDSCGATAAGAVCNSPVMGQALDTLSSALGTLSSIYQQGGPRSLQLALKLQF